MTEISKHIMFEETKEGLNLEIVDQDGRSMFAEGSKVPYERTRRLIQKLAAPLKATPLRVAIAGHTSAGYITTEAITALSTCRPIGPTRCVRSSSGRDFRRPTSSLCRARPILSRCSRTTPLCRP